MRQDAQRQEDCVEFEASFIELHSKALCQNRTEPGSGMCPPSSQRRARAICSPVSMTRKSGHLPCWLMQFGFKSWVTWDGHVLGGKLTLREWGVLGVLLAGPGPGPLSVSCRGGHRNRSVFGSRVTTPPAWLPVLECCRTWVQAAVASLRLLLLAYVRGPHPLNPR